MSESPDHGGVAPELEGKIDNSQAARRAETRMLAHDRHIRGAFDSLGLDWDFDDLVDYALGAPFLATLPEDLLGKCVGAMAATAIVTVERVRELDPEFSSDPPDPL